MHLSNVKNNVKREISKVFKALQVDLERIPWSKVEDNLASICEGIIDLIAQDVALGKPGAFPSISALAVQVIKMVEDKQLIAINE